MAFITCKTFLSISYVCLDKFKCSIVCVRIFFDIYLDHSYLMPTDKAQACLL